MTGVGQVVHRSHLTALAVLLVLLLLLTGCSSGSPVPTVTLAGETTDAVSDASTDAADDDSGLPVVGWAVRDDLVSVLVRNETARTLAYADVVMTAVDDHGTVLGSSPVDSGRSLCCSAADVPPGSTYGFWFRLPADDDRVAGVRLDRSDLVWSTLDRPAGPRVSASATGLATGSTTTTVTARLAVTGGAVAAAVVQAVLDGPDGHLEAVVTGRWTCLPDGAEAVARLQLFRPVDPASTVREVRVFPLPPGTDPGAC